MSDQPSSTQSPRTDAPHGTSSAPRQASAATRRPRKLDCSEAPAPPPAGVSEAAAGATGCQDAD